MTTGVLVLSALAFSLAGQLLWKSAAHDLAALGRVDFLLAAVRDARIVSGCAAWAMWTICWLQVLRVMPLAPPTIRLPPSATVEVGVRVRSAAVESISPPPALTVITRDVVPAVPL